eukprot:TRINITY_DN5405_c0_g1_i1.p1 TRINITY_DN5405_c0_g1~~TRINITY_DN5405_c0_g1_i1.p1  ORF type:complete len:3774 (+),score=616.56 TRINITY_DN5405_c0_g1_i1:91-11412(+)
MNKQQSTTKSTLFLAVATCLFAVSRGQVVDREDQEIAGVLIGGDGWSPGFVGRGVEGVANLTGNPRTIFKSRTNLVRTDSHRAPPTNAWWEDLLTTNATTEVVSVMPLQLKAWYLQCRIELSEGSTAVNVSSPNTTSTSFTASVSVVIGSASCFPQVSDSDRFGVNVTLNVNPANPAPVGNLLLARGHPYATIDVSDQDIFLFSHKGWASLSRLNIPTGGSVNFVGDFADLVDVDGDRWLVSLPAVTNITALSSGTVIFHDRINGFVRVSKVPVAVQHHTGGSGNLPHETFETLRQNAGCTVIGGLISHNHTYNPDRSITSVTGVRYTYTWRVIPAGCTPLMTTLPHHRGGVLSGTTETTLKYQSVLGDLDGVLGSDWRFTIPLKMSIDSPRVENYTQCGLVELFNALLSDIKTHGNGTLLADDEYGLQLYHMGMMSTTAKTLRADTQLNTVLGYANGWIDQLNDGVLVYDTYWGVVCTDRNTGSAHATCFGESHLIAYGEMLHALTKLWPILLDDTASQQDRIRTESKLARMARALIRNLANLSEKDEYFPVSRGFDWYTGLAWDRYGVRPNSPGRTASPLGTTLLAYDAVGLLGQKYLNDPEIVISGELLLSQESWAATFYLMKDDSDGLGVVVEVLDHDKSVRGDDLLVLAPFDKSVTPHIKPVIPFLNETQLALQGSTGTPFDIMLLSLLNPTRALQIHLEIGDNLGYTNASLDTRVGDVVTLMERNGGSGCSDAGFELPIRVLGTTIWYKNSFNYLFKVMDYQPTVIGKAVTSYNIYEMARFGDILRRDVTHIKSLGFNTVMISTATFSVDAFLTMCKELDMNVIVAQILPAAGFATEKFIAEADFKQMLTYLAAHTNIVMWSIDSAALTTIQDAIDYYVLLRKLRLLRDEHDPTKRPIMVPLTEFTLPKLTVNKGLYDLAVEVAILTTLEADYARIKTNMQFLDHPVIVNFKSDSWNHVNETNDEEYQSKFLKSQIEITLPLHSEQLLSGIAVTEYVDQYWRGSQSDPDFDCPDPSSFRHSVCGVRVAEFHDGMLTSEYMGINAQSQTWFKHCIRHKAAYYMLRDLLGGTALPTDHHEVCEYVDQTNSYWKLIIWVTVACGVACLCLIIASLFQEDTIIDDTAIVAKDRWAQADTDEIYGLITHGTTTLLDQPPFSGMNIQNIDEDLDDEEEVEVDSWEFCRWQVIIIQLDHLQKVIFDEMVCQLKIGSLEDVGENPQGFKTAVDTLHKRYLNSYLGWFDSQKTKTGAALGECHHVRWEIEFGSEEEPIYMPLREDVSTEIESAWKENVNALELVHDGRDYDMVIDTELCPERDIALIYDKYQDGAPVGTAYRRARTGTGNTTNDQLIDLLILLSLWHLGEQLTWFNGHWLNWQFHYVMKHMKFPATTILNDCRHFENRTVTMDDINESCAIKPYFDIEGTRGVDEEGHVLLKDGVYNEDEIKRYPFQKTFREPRKWGIVFSIIHNIYFIVHTQVMSFVFWSLVVNISARDQRLADKGISGMFDRMELVFFHSPDHLRWILTTCAKLDFWLVVVGEIMDVWMLGGFFHYTSQDWAPTFLRVKFLDYIKLRWSAYTSVTAFIILMGSTFWDDTFTATFATIGSYVLVRVFGIIISNAVLVLWPVRLRGAPRRGKALNRKEVIQEFSGSVLFWVLCYSSVQLFQAWIMFRTETVSWEFCDCDDSYSDIIETGIAQFGHDFFGRMFTCADKEPRCFTAVFLIWLTAIALFIVAVNAGFLVWTVLFGSFSHFHSQWKSRKARSLVGKKIQTAYILRSLNVKMLGFTDPRDTQVARKVWNRVIKELWDEYLISAFEYENLLIHTHVHEVQFALENDFAMERLSNFLEYIQSTDEDGLGPCSTYPSISIVIPVYGEDLVCAGANTTGAFNEKLRSHQQEKTQLNFLIDSYNDEWVNFVEHCVLDEEFFHDVLTEEQVDQMQTDVEELKAVTDGKTKRDMKGDRELRTSAANIIADKIHTQPHLFYEDELAAVQWWASMHMQTVSRTIRGMERKREAFRFMMELEQGYTETEKMRKDKIDLLTDDKFQIVLALQNLANNKWFSKNEQGLMLLWSRYPKVEVSFIIETLNYRNSPTVVRKVHEHVSDLWDCTRYLSCLALWDEDAQDWYVASAYARRNTLRIEKKVKYGLNGMMQGKAVNQAHSLMFTRGQLIQAIDANQDGYFDEALKLRSVTGRFFPEQDRSWSRHKIVGFPEYSITVKSGIIGRIAGYSEYIFVNLFQKVLAHPLGVRMHYGHPDFFDFSWILSQGGMSKSNPLINLNEDIFAGYHVTANGESVDHVSSMRDGKGRETNFDGANGFQMKLAFGASMQYRTRDMFELMRTSDVLKRHSIFYGSVGPYIYLITIVVLIYTTLFINLALTYSYKTDYQLSSRGSPYGSEWMVQMSLIETVPLFLQLTLDYGFRGFFNFLRDVIPATLYFLFVIMTRFSYFIQSSLNGSSAYIATGRTDPLFRRSFRHMFRYYGSTHFMPGMFLLMLVWLYMDIETRSAVGALWRTFWHWGVGIAFIVTPCVFNPALDLEGLWEDLKAFYLWVVGDFTEKLKKQKDVLTKHAAHARKDKFWEKTYEAISRKLHPKKGAADGDDGRSSFKVLVNEDDDSELEPVAIGKLEGLGEEVSSTDSDEHLPAAYPWADQPEYDFAADTKPVQGFIDYDEFADEDDDLEVVEFDLPEAGTVPPRHGGHGYSGAYQEHQMPYSEDTEYTSTEMTEIMPPPPMMPDIPAPPSLNSTQPASRGLVPTLDLPTRDEPEFPPPPAMDVGMVMMELPLDDDDEDSIPLPPPPPPPDFPPVHPLQLPLHEPVDANWVESDEDEEEVTSPPLAKTSIRKVSSPNALESTRERVYSSRGMRRNQSKGKYTNRDRMSEVSSGRGLMDAKSFKSRETDADLITDYEATDSGSALYDDLLGSLNEPNDATGKPTNVPSLTFNQLERARGTAAAFRTARGDGQKTARGLNPGMINQGGGKLKADTTTVMLVPEEEQEIVYDYDWLIEHEKNQAEIEKFLKVFRSLNGEVTGPNTHGGKVPHKVVQWKSMQDGFIKLGKVVDDATCKELLLGLGVEAVDFVQFIVCFHKAEGVEAGHGDYGIDRAVTDINRARHRELRHIQEQMALGKKGYLRAKDESEKIAALTVLHNTRREFKVKFQDSTEDKVLVKTNSLKHHWKISIILNYRGCSTLGAFLFSLTLFSLWCFAYFALWQDITWEVFIFVCILTWDYLLTMSNIGPIVLVTRVTSAVVIIWRSITMLTVDNKFYPTFVMTYALMHMVLEVQFSFWSCAGPYILRRQVTPGKENPKTLDAQREMCLISLLKDNRERYLWGFPYYFLGRQLMAIAIGLMQFIFGIIMLIIRTLIEFIKYLIDIMDGYWRRKNPTEATYIADKKHFISDDDCKGPPVNAWTNTVKPKVAHKLCQVTDPNVRTEYNKITVIEPPGKSTVVFDDLPPPPTLVPPSAPSAPSPMKNHNQQTQSSPNNFLSVSIGEPPLSARSDELFGRRGSRAGLGISRTNTKTNLLHRSDSFVGAGNLTGWHNPAHGPPPEALETNLQNFGSGLYRPASSYGAVPKTPQVQIQVPGSDGDSELSAVGLTMPDYGPEEPVDELGEIQSNLVYFGDGDQTNYVPTEAFANVLEFRMGIKAFYRFLGPVQQVRLEILGKEIVDSDPWPFLTSKNCFVQVLLSNMYAPRERKTAIFARHELRGKTALESRLLEILGKEIVDSDPWPFLTSKNCFVQVLLSNMYAPRERKTAIFARHELRGKTALESRLLENQI